MKAKEQKLSPKIRAAFFSTAAKAAAAMGENADRYRRRVMWEETKAKHFAELGRGGWEKCMAKMKSDLGDWDGAAKLEPEVSIEATDDPTTMRFKVTPGDGTATRAFLRIRK